MFITPVHAKMLRYNSVDVCVCVCVCVRERERERERERVFKLCLVRKILILKCLHTFQICHQDAEFNNVIAVGRRTLTEEVDTG